MPLPYQPLACLRKKLPCPNEKIVFAPYISYAPIPSPSPTDLLKAKRTQGNYKVDEKTRQKKTPIILPSSVH